MDHNSLPSHLKNIEKIRATPQKQERTSRSQKGPATTLKSKSPNTGKKSIALTLSLVLSTIVLALGAYLAHFDIGLKNASSAKSIGDMDDKSVAAQKGEPIDILILGTDTRSGSVNQNFGTDDDSTGDGNSDVMMLMRISGDRQRVSVISFPRDLMVPGPACKNPETGVETAAQNPVMVNSILGYGGPECSVKAFSNFTGIQVDHYMEADFNAVIELSNIVGGVEVCVNSAVDDPLSDLKLPAGKSEVQGEQALAFLRSRHGMGDGSDLGRIKSQQQFLSNLAKKLKSEGTLTNPIKVNNIAQAMLKYLNFDQGLANVPALVNLADILKDVPLQNVTFLQVPVEAWTQDANRLQLKQPDAKRVFDAVNADKDLSDPYSYNGQTKPPSAQPVDKASVALAVYNGSGTEGRDTAIATKAQQLGYTQAYGNGDSQESSQTSKVYYGTDSYDAAKQVAKDFGIQDAALVQDDTVTGVQILVGTDWTSGDTVPAEKVLPDGLSGQTADQDLCQVAATS
ncbi:MAG: LCP family protein [Micrococcaceae bacterium]